MRQVLLESHSDTHLSAPGVGEFIQTFRLPTHEPAIFVHNLTNCPGIKKKSGLHFFFKGAILSKRSCKKYRRLFLVFLELVQPRVGYFRSFATCVHGTAKPIDTPPLPLRQVENLTPAVYQHSSGNC